MPRSFFITATDTNAGKTWITSQLMTALQQQSIRAKALKPVACGVACDGINEDVAELMRLQHLEDPQKINLYSFAQPAAPSIAAHAEQRIIESEHLQQWCQQKIKQHDITLIEGIGGLMVPLTPTYLVSDWLTNLPDAEVILVVGAKLGCINHALLTLHQLASQKRSPACIIINDTTGKQDLDGIQSAISPYLSPNMPLLTCGYQQPESLISWWKNIIV